jgi:hypothetical protein
MTSGITGKIVVVIVLASSAMVARAQDSGDPWKLPDFSAIQLSGPKRKPVPMKVYWSGTSMRVDLSPAMSTLYLPAVGKVYKLTVYPDKTRECIVMKTEQAKMLPHPLELLHGAKVTRTPVRTETAEGHSCKVENVVVTRADGETVESKVWEAEDLKGIPVMIDSQTEHGKFLAVYRDIVIGPLDKALFTPPDKCIPYEKMGQVVEDRTLE